MGHYPGLVKLIQSFRAVSCRAKAGPFILALIFAALLLPAQAQFSFSVTDIGSAGGSSYAQGINNSGQIWGTRSGANFLYSNGVASNLNPIVWGGQGAPFAPITISVRGFNDAGILVGKGNDQNGTGPVPYLYSNNAISSLPTGAYNYPGNYGVAGSINNSGQIAGYIYGSDGYAHAAIFPQAGPSPTFINAFDWTNGSISINNSGQVAGTNEKFAPGFQQPSYREAFLYNGTSTSSLGTLGGTYSSATGINDAGQVVGYSATGSGADHAFLYSSGSMIDLGTLGGSSVANGINGTGVVVGASSGSAFIYSGGTMLNLNSVTDLSGSNFVSLANAAAINNAGQIVGYGLTSGGEQHAFLLTPTNLSPVPEPSTYGTICALSLVGLALRRHWKRRQTALFGHPAAGR